ncbi:MAG: hypothetical protein RL180_464 [Pseudomonadota bacterium]|jgi:hypothetical protein
MKISLHVLISAFIAAFIYWGYLAYQDEPINTTLLVQQWNIELALPTIDGGTTRVDELTVVGNTIMVKYQLLKYQGFTLEKNARPALSDSVHQLFCPFFIRDTDFAQQFKTDQLRIEAKYFNANGLILMMIPFEPWRCAVTHQAKPAPASAQR